MRLPISVAVCTLLLFAGMVGGSQGSSAPPLSIQVKTLQAQVRGLQAQMRVLQQRRLPAGPRGPIGLTGPQGAQGLPGTDGLTGATGATGATGEPGAQGPAGPRGPEGPAGPTGAQGDRGDQGPPGSQGPAGDAGEQGRAGTTTPTSTVLQSGHTLIGDLAVSFTALQSAQSQGEAVTFSVPLPGPPTAVQLGGSGGCPGAGSAAPGTLCLYSSSVTNVRNVLTAANDVAAPAPNTADRLGFLFQISSILAGQVVWQGSFAYTAP